MTKLSAPLILVKENNDPIIKDFLVKSLEHFYDELDSFCVRNKNTNFGQWFSESGFLSMYINGIIRHDTNREVSAVQEYCVSNHINGGSARCDGFIEFDENVFLIEAKRQKYVRQVATNHFDLKGWLEWDKEEIQIQLRNYLTTEEKFFLQESRYKNCYLVTMVFKIIKEKCSDHIQKANKMNIQETETDRVWYYSTSFIEAHANCVADGIEMYGTIEKHI